MIQKAAFALRKLHGFNYQVMMSVLERVSFKMRSCNDSELPIVAT
jgi:hypothetical protein